MGRRQKKHQIGKGLSWFLCWNVRSRKKEGLENDASGGKGEKFFAINGKKGFDRSGKKTGGKLITLEVGGGGGGRKMKQRGTVG